MERLPFSVAAQRQSSMERPAEDYKLPETAGSTAAVLLFTYAERRVDDPYPISLTPLPDRDWTKAIRYADPPRGQISRYR
jgi:hypothetical protein